MDGKKEKSDAFVRMAMERVAKERIVLDVGGGGRFGKWMRPYESLFAGCDYKTMDFDVSTGADIVGDIHAIPLPDSSVDAVICSSVLEHVRDPLAAMKELRRIVRPGGQIFLYVPSIYPYHAHKGHYPDYWRFFRDTIDELFAGCTDIRIQKRGGYFLALSFFVPGQAKMRGILNPLAEFFDTLFKTENRSTTAGYYVLATT
ncbi:MAG TPA: class I SAM-dependent methyltransferase [Candidatus Paceibacterota bacterium]|nr:class I SAM-dependent methyltransferase [Candidatus Paceibacterota bacterium]